MFGKETEFMKGIRKISGILASLFFVYLTVDETMNFYQTRGYSFNNSLQLSLVFTFLTSTGSFILGYMSPIIFWSTVGVAYYLYS